VSDIVHFPPLPPIRIPSDFRPDERQRTFDHAATALTGSIFEGNVAVANSTLGFRASAVDLGAIQTLLNDGLARLSMAQVHQRWEEDVKRWISAALRAWIQRCKEMSFQLADNGVHVSIETQDDHGYYRYEFDVFPGRDLVAVKAE
jgi:hypothetical protein